MFIKYGDSGLHKNKRYYMWKDLTKKYVQSRRIIFFLSIFIYIYLSKCVFEEKLNDIR